MVQYYRYMWPRWSRILSPLEELSSIPKCTAIIWNYELEVNFLELKRVVSAETLLNFPNWTIVFTVHKYAYDKHYGAVISQDDKHITLFSIKLIRPQSY